jgi:hypothetical protein
MLAACAATLVCEAQGPNPQLPPTFKLDTHSENPLPVPNFAWSGRRYCDASRNAYFAITDRAYSNKYILRISADGQQATPFQLPSDLGTEGSWMFYVSPGGTIYALFSRHGTTETQTLVEISSSGEELRRTELKLPGGFDPFSFAVLPSGRLMVQGRLLLPPKSPEGGKPVEIPGFLYTAWLDPNGKVVRDSGTNPNGKDVINLANFWGAKAIVAGPQDTFLSVSESSLNTYDSKGLLLHSVRIAKPEKDAFAQNIQYLDGQAEIDYYVLRDADSASTPEDGPHPLVPDPNADKVRQTTKFFHDIWLRVDPATGTAHGFFELPDNFPGSGVCYLGSQDFLYLAMKSMKPIFVEARPK